MKISLLFVALFLMFSKTSFGDGNSNVNNFSDYVNSPPESSSGTSVNKDINMNHEVLHEAGKNSDKKGAKAVLQGIPAQWQVCTIDSDCTAAVADCVTWEAINKKYLKKLSKNLRSCSESIDPGFQPEAVCAAKMCQTTEKNTDVSWEEWLKQQHIVF